MKKFLLISLFTFHFSLFTCSAQNTVEYYLPKTQLKFTLMVEKTVYTPGEFAVYSEHYLRKKQSTEASFQYKLLGIEMQPVAVADANKHYTLTVDQKHTVINLEREQNGVLTAVNCQPKPNTQHPTPNTQHPTPNTINPHDYMSQEILAAGSTSKMAELTAKEIYDIRDSRNQLARGEADFMPKDGEQLKLMMQNLDKQERILSQTFEGVTLKDTTLVEVVFNPVPTDNDSTVNTKKDLLFRFSKWLGVVSNNDLSGVPYYISVTDLITMPELPKLDVQTKKKEQPYLAFSLPGKIKVEVDSEDGKNLLTQEIYASQYGRVEQLPQSLFGKKILTKVQINPVTGYIEKISTEPIE